MNDLLRMEKTNIKIIDRQHKEITVVVNNYFESPESTPEDFNEFMLGLKKLVKIHFETEENLMIRSIYENYYSHKQEHDRFLRKVNTYNYDNKDVLFGFIRDWLSNHLLMKDMKLGNFLAEKSGQIV